jgi:hypothetical protein
MHTWGHSMSSYTHLEEVSGGVMAILCHMTCLLNSDSVSGFACQGILIPVVSDDGGHPCGLWLLPQNEGMLHLVWDWLTGKTSIGSVCVHVYVHMCMRMCVYTRVCESWIFAAIQSRVPYIPGPVGLTHWLAIILTGGWLWRYVWLCSKHLVGSVIAVILFSAPSIEILYNYNGVGSLWIMP